MAKENEMNEKEIEAAESSVEDTSTDLNATEDDDQDTLGDDESSFPGVDYGDKRVRGWFMMRSYLYDRDDASSPYHQVTEDVWRKGVQEEWEALADEPSVSWMQFIMHDKDVVKKGDTKALKPLHAHGVVRFEDAKTQSAVMKKFCGNNRRVNNVQPVDPRKGGFKSALLYLTHHTDSAYKDEKTWYHHEDVVQVKAKYLDLIKSETAHKMTSAQVEVQLDHYIDEVVNGNLSFHQAKKEFAKVTSNRTLVRYKKDLESAYAEYRDRLARNFTNASHAGTFKKVVTYVSGPGRSGKSLVCDMLARIEHGPENVFSPATGGSENITDDFVDGHETESATVFHDLSPLVYKKRSWFTMFDPHVWTKIRSRGKVKPWFSKSVYMAVNLPVGEFVISMLSRGQARLAVTPNNAEDIRMAFGRVTRVLTYGEKDGQPVVWIGHRRLDEDLPSKGELVTRYKKQGYFDSKIAEDFYQIVGFVPYDEDAPVREERERIATIVASVFSKEVVVGPDEFQFVDGIPAPKSPFQ